MSSRNVFLDLGLPPVKSAIWYFRSELVMALIHIKDANRFTQAELAEMLGTDQPTISKVLNEKNEIVSIDRLMSWLGMLGVQVRPSFSPIGLLDMEGNPSQDETDTPVLEGITVPWDQLLDDEDSAAD